ncbi:MAG: hypothetical protein ACYC65_00025, partial [Candidatus Limnocylindrales bacterium]
FADGHEYLLVGDAVLESSRSGRWVEIARDVTATAAGRCNSSRRHERPYR